MYQKLKSFSKTQGKISKNLKFLANPLSSSKAGKTSKKACSSSTFITFSKRLSDHRDFDSDQ